MSVEEARSLVAQMRAYYRARAPWHDDLMGYVDKTTMEALLRPIVTRLQTLLAGRDVLEVACGTGNWTQVLSGCVRSVLATDVNEETLRIAQTKEYPPGIVGFRPLDAYALGNVGVRFNGAFAADWWSHVPRSLLGVFLDDLHGCLAPGGRVVFIDMLPRDHPDLKPYRHDREGNAICRRSLPDGRAFDVVKNFPGRGEVLGLLAGRGERVEYQEWRDLARWLVSYAVSAHPSGPPDWRMETDGATHEIARGETMASEMSAEAAADLIRLIENAGIEIWLDGGWAVDAVVGEQTRIHKDLDIIVSEQHLPKLCQVLVDRGFARQPGGTPSNFVLSDRSGLEVDVHAVVFDQDGNGLYRMEDGETWVFPASGLKGRGVIGSLSVRCITPEVQVQCHAYGYVLKEKDFHDMELLASRCGVELPPQLRRSRRPAGDSD